MLPAGNPGESLSVVVVSDYPPPGSPLLSRVLADELMVGTVSTSPVLLVGGLSTVNHPGLVLLSVDVVSTSPVSFQVVSRDPVQPPGRREGRSRCFPT